MLRPMPRRFLVAVLPFWISTRVVSLSPSPPSFVVLGGTGRIGTAVCSHLLLKRPDAQITLVGRNGNKGSAAVQEALSETGAANSAVKFVLVEDCWGPDDSVLKDLISASDCVINTAGPYLGKHPVSLGLAISSGCPAYIDVSDPLDYLETALGMNNAAEASGTTALLCAGAFPGLSNVLAMEAASKLSAAVRDVRFNYFTAGLGGSGDVNLYITNLGFGEPMAQFENGKLRLFKALSGLLIGTVDFFVPNADKGFGNDAMKRKVGTQQLFAWPFPEAATVAKELQASGDSSAAMGTAPDVWNSMLGVLVALVPRRWWRSEKFSKFLADFSQPLVKATDTLLKLQSDDGVGETHGMRVDVTGEDGSSVSIVQGHESFRRCVGQSCAEFALDLLEHPEPGVKLPEQRYRDPVTRSSILERLTSTPGTFTYTGPVLSKEAALAPTEMEKAIQVACLAEMEQR